MNEDAIIKVGFDFDISQLQEYVNELQKKLDNVRIDTKMDRTIFTDIKQLITKFNTLKQSMTATERGTDTFNKLDDSVSKLYNSLHSARLQLGSMLTQERLMQREVQNTKKDEQERQRILESANISRKEQIEQIIANRTEEEKLEAKKMQALHDELYATDNLSNAEKQASSENIKNLNEEIALNQELNKEKRSTVPKQADDVREATNLIKQKINAEKQGEAGVHKERTKNEKKAHTQGLINIRKKRSLIISGIKEFYTNVTKYTKMWMGLLGSAFTKVGTGFKNLLGSIFNRTGKTASSLLSNLKGLLGIAGGIGLYKLGSEAISVSNEFKNLGDTSEVVARKMSDAFYDAAGDSYNELVKLSNGTTKVTTTLTRFINTWTGQIALMKAQLTAIGTNLGNLLIKVFYPLLVVLNKILAVVNLLVNKLASLFGFNTASLKNILGDIGGASENNKGMDAYAKATDKAAKSTKKLKDETKKAKDNLQSYDKLNNNTTDNLDELSDTLDDLSDLGGVNAEGLIDTDKLFDNLMQDLDLIPDWLKKWINDLTELIKEGDWNGVGRKIGELVNKGLYALNDFLSDPDLIPRMQRFNSALLNFINGLADEVDWRVLGNDVAKGLNTITFAIDDLYTQAVQKDTLKKIGDAIYNTLKGFLDEFEPEQAGRAATSLLRSIIDIVHQALSNIDDKDIEQIAKGIHGVLSGAFDRLLGISEGENKSGAKKIGESIAKLINIALESIGELINKDTATSAADAIIDILNSAILGLDEVRMKKALSGMLQFIGQFFSKLATEINTDEFIDKITGAINNSIENGDVETAVKGFTKFINNVIQALKKMVYKIDWKGLLNAIKNGFVAGGGEEIIKDWLIYVVAPSAVLALAHGFAKAAEWKAVGRIVGLKSGSAISGALAAGGKGLFALKNLAGIGGGLTAVIGFLDSVNNGLTKANLTATVLGGTLMGLSMGGPVGAVIGALLAGIAELGVAYEQNAFGFRDWVDGIIAGISTLKNDVSSKIDEIKTSIQNKFNNIIKSAYSWGRDIIQGLINGITSKIGNVSKTVNSIVNTVTSTFRKGLQIFSPSHVMRDLAYFIPEGVAVGIEEGESDVTSAIDSMLESVKFSDFYNESLSETDSFVQSVEDKLAGITTPSLDTLKYTNKILTSPSSTANALSQSYADRAEQRTDGVLAGIYNRMINAGQNSGKNVTVDVYLDKNNRLGQFVIDTVKGNVVMTGGV